MSNSFPGPNDRTGIIACEVFRDELEHLGVRGCRYLEQGLHRYPSELRARLAGAIREAEAECGRIILVYGYCGGGLEDISSVSAEIVFPAVHDCIHLFLGRKPEGIGDDGKGQFVLTRGWLQYGKNPYTEYLGLRERFGHELAYWGCKEMVKNYRRVVFVRTLPEGNPVFRQESEAFARFFGMEHVETEADLRLLQSLVWGQPGGPVLRIQPRSRITRDSFT